MIRKTDSVRIVNGKIEIGGVIVATMVGGLPPTTQDMAEEILKGSGKVQELKDTIWDLNQQIRKLKEGAL